ncbi:hypothetical protein PsorP6_001163 [Peronosclerospora sorghi]|uniref:Uncharacterized protein n=1 Tax=Peronosclerospora sorghi TaxID=230839 RepID=A0ACC0WUD7_9STRA|nr:hypothetical protein PsorP6_001163 [Peronosclerospora sorghi]
MAQRVSAVTLMLGDEAREMMLIPGLDLSELLQCIAAGFPALGKHNLKPPVAVQHGSSHVFYPLSLLCRSPELFENAVYHLVLEGESRSNTKQLRSRLYPHNRKRTSRTRGTSEQRELETITTTSDGNDEDEEELNSEEGEKEYDEAAVSIENELEIDLSDFELPQLVNVFTQACPTGALDRITFNRCLEKILSQSGRYDPQARQIFTRLFNTFEQLNLRKDIVDVVDFLGGLSVLTCGERDEKVRLIFELYDVDSDGFITEEEMTKYLTAVFLVIGKVAPDLLLQNNVNPAELGMVTASKCFAESALDREGKLSYQEFKKWYSKPGPPHLSAVTEANNNRVNAIQSSRKLDLASLRKVTGLSALSASELFSILHASTAITKDGRHIFSRAEFKQCFYDIVERLNRKVTGEITNFLDRLFNAFDRDGSDSVDYVQLSCALSVMCGGSDEDNVVTALSLFDTDRNGHITYQNMETYLTAVFSVLCESSIPTTQLVRTDTKALAYYTTMQAFNEFDLNRDGRLSPEEFRFWYWYYGRHYLQIPVGPPPAASQQQLRVPGTLAYESIGFVASSSGLCELTPSDVFEIIAAKVNEDGVLSRESFLSAVDELAEARAAKAKRVLGTEALHQQNRVMATIFDGFDTDRDGFVDFCELSSGISILCGGSQEKKIKAAFALFDINRDGFVSRDEIETYLASVFRMVYMASPVTMEQLNRMSPEELARITIKDAFKIADANVDSRVSYDEFTKWYSSQQVPPKRLQSHEQTALSPNLGILSSTRDSGVLSKKQVLTEVRELTNLGAYDINDIFEYFQASADEKGNVSQPVFFRCFNKLLAKDGRISRDTQLKTDQLFNELFELFDVDKNGVVDVVELGAGLSILCGGNRADKAKAMFTLYDTNRDGYITPEEMTLYLTSVFKILFKTSPEISAEIGLRPEQLAKETTEGCFQAFDDNQDGQLSFEEFRAWFEQQKAHSRYHQHHNSNGSRPILSSPSSPHELATASIIPIEVAQKLSGLEHMSLNDVVKLFDSARSGGDWISRRMFDECFHKHICNKSTEVLSTDESMRLRDVMDRIFLAFDSEQRGIVDFNELMSGISILCSASRDEKVLAAVKRYDLKKDGLVSRDEVTHYLGAVFKLIYALDPTRAQRLGIPANALATMTASEMFYTANVNSEGKMSVNEFHKWSMKPEQASLNDIVAPLDINEVRRLTNLGNLDVVEVFERFAEHANEEGMLIRDAFEKCFIEIIEIAQLRTQFEKLRAKILVNRLYDVFDRDGNGQIDFSELASGLSVLCKGARDAKVKAAFRLYDFNDDGFISLEDMKRFLTSIFKVLYEVQPQMRQKTGVSPEELGATTTEQAFLKADTNNDGKLSYDEFLKWYHAPAQAGINNDVVNNAIVDSSLPWPPLNEMKQLTNLAQYKPEEVFEIFAGEANEDGLLSRDAFNESFRKVINGQKFDRETSSDDTEAQIKLHGAIDNLFDLFDHDNNGTVDFGELASGLSVLCGGTKDQKVEAAFSLIDFNGDGFISLDEMTRYITSVFRVLFQVSPETQSLGVTPEELGEVTAQQAFSQADLDHDGQLTREEFQCWYQQVGGSTTVAKIGKQLFNEAEAPRQINLQTFSPSDVFNTIASYADERGYVSRKAFDECIQKIISTNQHLNSEEIQLFKSTLDRLYMILDVDKSEMVDSSEIANGLTIFCGGFNEKNVRDAFTLYDYDADGYISIEEMTQYLSNIFTVLKETTPAVLRHLTEASEEMALRTAQQAFKDANLDHEGRLTSEEFRKWYIRSNFATIERLVQNNIPELLLLREVQCLTNLNTCSVQEVLAKFAQSASADGTMDKNMLRQTFGHFIGVSSSNESKNRLLLVVDRLFAAFDKDKNGLLDFNELTRGLTLLCGENQTEQVLSAFSLYDLNRDGYISLGEMRLFLISIFKVFFEVSSGYEAQIGVTPAELGETQAEQVFAEADHDKDGKLSFAEFSRWYMQVKTVEDDASVSVDRRELPQKIQQQVPDWINLDVVKQMTHLEKYTADEVFEIFANRCSEDGTLSREAFEECFEQLVDEEYKNDEANLARLRLILNRLFVLFDEDCNGNVDFCELSSGLSVLCGGSQEDKVRAAFSLFDLNHNGFIALDEMIRYLTSVFKVLYETSPWTKERLNVQPKELAIITAEQCFMEANLNEDGKLSFNEFVAWYTKSSGFVSAAGRHVDLQQGANNSTRDSCDGSPSQMNRGSKSSCRDKSLESPRRTVSESGNWPASITSTAPASFPSDKHIGITGANGDALLSPQAACALSMSNSNMEHVRRLLKLDTYQANDVLEIFAEAAPSGELTFAAFKKCFDQIIRLAGGHDHPKERHDADVMIRRLFRIFDKDNSNTVNFGELASGLSVLSGSSIDDKARAAFQLNDSDEDGYITHEEMINYLTSVFKVMYETTNSTTTDAGVSPEDLAREVTGQCFEGANLNGDNKLSFKEFKKVSMETSCVVPVFIYADNNCFFLNCSGALLAFEDNGDTINLLS